MRGNFKRKIIVNFIIVLACFVTSQSSAVEFAGGTGEPNDPYQIATAQQLTSIGDDRNLLDKHFVLVSDIDLDPNLLGGKVFTQAVIASYRWTDYGDHYERTHFSGSLDGNGHSISNMVIEGYETGRGGNRENLGLIGYLTIDAVVKDIQLRNITIFGVGDYVGGLAGSNRGKVLQCSVTGSITGESFIGGLVGSNNGDIVSCSAFCNVQSVSGGAVGIVGGLIGYNYGHGFIYNCYSIGTVTGWEDVGGLVGLNGSYISNCYAICTTIGSEFVGGLVCNNSFNGYISNCYATGIVKGDKHVGGLIGNHDFSHAIVSQCYAACEIIADPNDSIGGLIGKSTGQTTNSFWDIQVSGQKISAGGIGLSTAKLQDPATYLSAGWDMVGEISNGLSDIWIITEQYLSPIYKIDRPILHHTITR